MENNYLPTAPPSKGGDLKSSSPLQGEGWEGWGELRGVELTILIPCLNEEGTVGVCVAKAKKFLEENKIEGEVLVADNGSADRSAEAARKVGARVINISARGYGNAIAGGIKAAKGQYIIVGDADESYDFSALGPFLEKLRGGADLVVGNRFAGGIERGAMPTIHKYLGNPGITWLGNILFGFICGDYYCGLRGFKKDSILGLNLKEPGMQFAVEMLVMARLKGIYIEETPTILYPAPSTHKSHIQRWRDGWKTIKLFLSLRSRKS